MAVSFLRFRFASPFGMTQLWHNPPDSNLTEAVSVLSATPC
jgi:hypothetical protein